jgi:hypothetical protein
MIAYKKYRARFLHIVQSSQPPESDYTDYLYGCDRSLKEVNRVGGTDGRGEE